MDNIHWTEKSKYNMLFRIVADFFDQINSGDVGEQETWQNMTLMEIIALAEQNGKNISILTYDKDKNHGPIFSDVFRRCWEIFGKPNNLVEAHDILGDFEKDSDGN